MLSGDNGILQKATDAKTLTERSSVVEQARTDVLGYQVENKGEDLDKTQLKTVLDKYFDGVPDLTDMEKDTILNTELQTLAKYGTHTISVYEIYNGNFKGGAPQVTGNLNANEITGLPNGVVEISKEDVTNSTIKNNDNIRAVITGEVPIPNGFYYVGGTKDEGVVISDSVADSGKGTSHSVAQTLQGNQFVWIPVPVENDFKAYEGYNGSWVFINSIQEPYTNGYSTEVSEFNEMKSSVINNKGFFVARYEASNNNGNIESKQGKSVWNNISWGEILPGEYGSPGTLTDGAVYKAKQMYTENSGYNINSTLIYGIQWDAIMVWIDSAYKTHSCDTTNSYVANSSSKGYYNQSSPAVTGSSDIYAVKNIYDLAGNVMEWTMEMNRGDYGMVERVSRGGAYYTNVNKGYSASCRYGNSSMSRSDIFRFSNYFIFINMI